MDQKTHTPVAIYALSHPRTGEIRYVGKTIKTLNDRLCIHIAAAKRGNKTHRCAWIRSLIRDGIKPVITALEIIPDGAAWAEREQHWIKTLRDQGVHLTNATDGGEGWHGLRHTEETKRKIGAAHKGRTISEAQREKQSQAMRGRVLTEEHKRKVSAAGKGRQMKAETKALLSAIRKGAPCAKTSGESNGRAKLTRSQVDEIRASASSHAALGRLYGISATTVADIRKGKIWK